MEEKVRTRERGKSQSGDPPLSTTGVMGLMGPVAAGPFRMLWPLHCAGRAQDKVRTWYRWGTGQAAERGRTTLRIMDAFMDAWRSVCVSVALSALATSRGVPAVVTRASRSLSSAA